MKKIIIFFILFVSVSCYSQKYNQEGVINFKVKANHYYEFELPLRGNTQYLFKIRGENLFNFRIIEPSGNEWELQRAYFVDNNVFELIVRENIMEKGSYHIRIYSIADNYITLMWGEY